MKHYVIVAILLLTLSGSFCCAQDTVKDDFKPSTLNQPGQ